MQGDLSGKVGCIPEADVMGEFGVEEVNVNRKRLVNMRRDTIRCVGNMYFKRVLKYTWYRTSQDMNVKCLIDYVLVRKNILEWVNRVKVLRGLSGSLVI